MSMSLHVVGLVPPDADWRKHKAVWDACEAAGVRVPDGTESFFNGEPPDPAGMEIPLDKHLAVKPYKAEMAEGFDVNLNALPEKVKALRFFYSC